MITFAIIVVAITKVITVHCICHNSQCMWMERFLSFFLITDAYFFLRFSFIVFTIESRLQHLVVITETLNNLYALPMDV